MAAIKKAAESTTKSSKGKAAKPVAESAAKMYEITMQYQKESKGGNFAVFSAPRDNTALAVGSVYIAIGELPKDSRPDEIKVTVEV